MRRAPQSEGMLSFGLGCWRQRRRGLVVLLMVAGLAAPVRASAADWVGYRGGAGQNLFALTDPGLEVGTLWESAFVSDFRPGCVAVADGKVFAIARSPSAPLGQVGMYALDAVTGAVVWSRVL